MGPLSILFLMLFFIVVIIISILGLRYKTLFKIGMRNLKRRKMNTLIVVLGLMIGTAIISGSLVVSDTLKNMFTKGVYDSYDETDETVFSYDTEGNYAFFDYSEYEKLNEFKNKNLFDLVEDISPEIIISVSAFDKDTKLSEPSVTLTGYDYNESKKFGKFKTIEGKEITGEKLGKYDILVNELLADEMDIEQGHKIEIFYGFNQSIVCNVSHVLKDEGRATFGWSFMGGGMNIFMPLENVQDLLSQQHRINFMKISNIGCKISGMKHSDDVEKELKPYLNNNTIDKTYLFPVDLNNKYLLDKYNGINSVELSNEDNLSIQENLSGLWMLFYQSKIKISLNYEIAKTGENIWEIKFNDIEKTYLILEEENQLNIYDKTEQVLLMNKGKQNGVENAIDGSKGLRDLFMVMGTFSIIAGMMLIVNIFVMLAEERKSEMGMARAVGMRQRDLKRMFLFEGTAYAILSSFVGTIGGLGVAFAIILAFGEIFGGFNSLQFFTFTTGSLIASFCAGFLITILTIYFSSNKVSKLNIIRAIRNIPEPRYKRHEMTKLGKHVSLIKRMRIRMSDIILRQYEIFIILISLFSMLCFFVDIIHPLYHVAWVGYASGLSMLIYGVGLLLRRYIVDEKAFTLSGVIVLILWSYPYDIYDQLFGIDAEDLGMEMFVLAGLFLVSSSLMVIMYNSDFLLNGLIRLFKGFRSLVPVFKTAISYPMNSKFRTGITLGMFSLIIFTVTVLAMIMGLISGNIDQLTDEQSGGYDMIVVNNQETPFEDISKDIENNANLSREDFSKIVPLYTSLSSAFGIKGAQNQIDFKKEINKQNETDFLEYQENATWYSLIGCSKDFFEKSNYELEDWDKEKYDEYEDAWKAVQNNDSLAIVDITVIPQEMGPQIEGLSAVVGDYIIIRDTMNHSKVVKVAGIMKQGIIQGIFVKDSVVKVEFETDTSFITLFEFKNVISDKEQEDIGKKMESEFIANGVRTIVIKEVIEEQLEMMNNFFYLLEAFLGLGLIVGIAGLGIITIRSVKERHQQIGMLRAIGFRRNMILKSFIIEISFIAILGIILGVVLGIIIGVRIWLGDFSDVGFVIPWTTIIIISIISYVVTFICTISSARKAAKIAPAEALRYVG